jgi:predicted TIM-barrel fold metal-dependent hydrolase
MAMRLWALRSLTSAVYRSVLGSCSISPVPWVTLTVLLLLASVAPACTGGRTPAPPAAPAAPKKIDVHTHFGPEAAAHMIELMDAHGITQVWNLSGGPPLGGLEEQLAAARRYPGRIVVFTMLDWEKAREGPSYGTRMVADLVRAKELGARGLKIPKGLGLGYEDHTGHVIAVDDPELDAVFRAAGELGFPVAIHVGDPVAFFKPATPENERWDELQVHPDWSFHGQGYPTWEELFAALERRIARHPGTKFISVHFGNAAEYPERVAALLDKYPNLYVDTAARIPELGRHDAAKLRAIFLAHADRILFGTDLGVGAEPQALMLGSTGATPPGPADVERFFAATWRFFETADHAFPHPTPIQGRWTIDGINLPGDALSKIYSGNAERLLAQ